MTGVTHFRDEELLRIVSERQIAKVIAFYIKDIVFKIHPNEGYICTAILSLPNSIIVLMRKKLVVHVSEDVNSVKSDPQVKDFVI